MTEEKETINIRESEIENMSDSEDTVITNPSFKNTDEHLTADATILIFGPASAGKTCLLQRIVSNKYNEMYTPTQIDQKTLEFFKSQGYPEDCTLTFYDMAGQEDYQQLYKFWVDLCSIVFICFPINDKDNLETVENNHLSLFTFLTESKKPLVYLVGTKSDLKRQYSEDEEREYKSLLKKIQNKTGYPYFETSSLEGKGYKELMSDLISKKGQWPDIEKQKKDVKYKTKKKSTCLYCF